MLDTAAVQRHTDFELTPQQRSLLELDAFLQTPRSIGIDSLKESLSNIVRYMLELQGLDTGQNAQILLEGEHDSISLDDKPTSAKNKRKRMEMDADMLRQLEEQMQQNFETLFDHVETQLDNVSANITKEIEELDAQIDAMDDHSDDCTRLQSKKEKRQRLKSFKQRVKAYQKEISAAAESMDASALIEIEQNLYQDHEAFNARGIFPPAKRASNIFDFLPRSKTKMPIFPEGTIDFGLQDAVQDLVKGADDLVHELMQMARLEAKSNSASAAPDVD